MVRDLDDARALLRLTGCACVPEFDRDPSRNERRHTGAFAQWARAHATHEADCPLAVERG
jgi:hypothetical protein